MSAILCVRMGHVLPKAGRVGVLVIVGCFFAACVAVAAPIRQCTTAAGGINVCTIKEESKQRIAVGDTISRAYDWTGSPVFSSGGTRYAYKAREGNDWFVVDNGREGKHYDEILSLIVDEALRSVGFNVFGPLGGMVYGGRKGSDWFVGAEDREYGPYDEVRFAVLSPGGETMAFRARRGDRWFMVVNGSEGEAHDWVGMPVLNNDGLHVAYRGRNGARWFAVYDTTEDTSYDWVGTPVFVPSGAEIAYIARRGTEWFVVSGEERFGPFEDILSLDENRDRRLFGMLTFDDTGKAPRYRARRNGVWSVFEGAREQERDTRGARVISEAEREAIKQLLEHMALRLETIAARFRVIASRIEARVDKYEEIRGGSASGLRNDLALARRAVWDAEQGVKELRSAVDAMTGVDDTASLRGIVSNMRPRMGSVIDAIKRARFRFIEILEEIRAYEAGTLEE